MHQQTSTSNIEYISDIANNNQDKIFNYLGLTRDRNGHIKCECPVHCGDNPSGFSWHPEKCVWKCWTNKCHEEYSSSLVGLVAGIKKISLQEACKVISNILYIKDFEIDNAYLERSKFIRDKKPRIENPVEYYSLPNQTLNEVPYFLDRGYSKEILSKYYCFLCNKKDHNLYGRSCVSIVDDIGRCIGYSGRISEDLNLYDKFNPKWKHFPYGMPKSKVLFGLHQNLECIKENGYVIIVEGPLDVMGLDQNGICNVVGLMGTNISKEQIELLFKYNITDVIIMMDPDEAGLNSANKLKEKLERNFNLHDLTNKFNCDPGDLTLEEIKNNLIPEINRIENIIKAKYRV